ALELRRRVGEMGQRLALAGARRTDVVVRRIAGCLKAREEASAIVGEQRGHFFKGLVSGLEKTFGLFRLQVVAVEEREVAVARGAIAAQENAASLLPQDQVPARQHARDRRSRVFVALANIAGEKHLWRFAGLVGVEHERAQPALVA